MVEEGRVLRKRFWKGHITVFIQSISLYFSLSLSTVELSDPDQRLPYEVWEVNEKSVLTFINQTRSRQKYFNKTSCQ